MKVGLDYLPAVSHAPGVGRYARELVRALVRLEEQFDLALFEVGRAPRTIGEPALGLADPREHGAGPRVTRVRARVPRSALSLAHAAGFGADRWLGGVDVFHRILPGTPSIARAPVTLAVGELPPAGTGAERALARELASATRVLAFSEHYARELARRFDLDPGRIARVPVGADHWRRDRAPLAAADRRPVVLTLGAETTARRRVELLAALDALEREGLRVCGQPLELEVVGRRGPASPALDAALARSPLAAAGRVRRHAELAEPELAHAVASAALVVQLDDDVGTAVTPLEALSLGAPVVASRLPALVEALDGHVTWVENERLADGPAHLAGRIREALAAAGDGALRDAHLRHAAGFTWDRCARATLAVWREVAEGVSTES